MKLNELKQDEQSAVSGGSILSGLPLLGGSNNDGDGSGSSGHNGGHNNGSDDHNGSDSSSSGLPIIGDLLGI